MKSINDFLKQQVGKNNTPSIQYTFFDTDSIIYEFHEGWSDIQAAKAINASTTYNLFSVTKTVTALAVLQLAQAGRLQLNERITKYLYDFPYRGEITIEHLLNHSSGIPNPLPLRWTHLTTEHDVFNRDLFFSAVFKNNNKLKFIPGAKFLYSNLGYVLLGQLIEKVSGKPYEAYVKEHILDKAEIEPEELGFTIAPAIHAKGYEKRWSVTNSILGLLIDKKRYMGKPEGKWQPFYLFYINGTPYGGMIGSRKGLIKYAQALLKKEEVFLNEQYKNQLFKENWINNKATGMAGSWFKGNLKGHTYYAHAGGGGGYYVELRIYPESGIGSVILYNRSGLSDKRILSTTDRFFLPQKEYSNQFQ